MQKHIGHYSNVRRQKILLYVREHLATSNIRRQKMNGVSLSEPRLVLSSSLFVYTLELRVPGSTLTQLSFFSFWWLPCSSLAQLSFCFNKQAHLNNVHHSYSYTYRSITTCIIQVIIDVTAYQL